MVKKITMSLPDEVADNLTLLAEKMAISRSALVTELLGEAVKRMLVMTQIVPDKVGDETYKRFRGESRIMIKQRIKEIEDYADEVFDND